MPTDDSSPTKFKPIWLLPIAVGVLAIYVLSLDRCIRKLDLGLSAGELTVEFCDDEQKAAVALLEQAHANFLQQLDAVDDDGTLRARYEVTVGSAIGVIRGDTSSMGPMEDSVRSILQPFLEER